MWIFFRSTFVWLKTCREHLSFISLWYEILSCKTTVTLFYSHFLFWSTSSFQSTFLFSHSHIILCSCAGLIVHLFDNIVASLPPVPSTHLLLNSSVWPPSPFFNVLLAAQVFCKQQHVLLLPLTLRDCRNFSWIRSLQSCSALTDCWWISHCLPVVCSSAWFLSVLDVLIFVHCPHKWVLWAKNVL